MVKKVEFWSYYSLIDIEYTLLGDPPRGTPLGGTPKMRESDNLLAEGMGVHTHNCPFSPNWTYFVMVEVLDET